MASNKGILTLEQEKYLSGLLDDTAKLKGIPEFLDGFVFKAVISFIDDSYIDKLDEELKLKLGELVDAVIAEDIELSEVIAADLIASLVKIPGLESDENALIFKGVIELLVGTIIKAIKDKQAAKAAPKEGEPTATFKPTPFKPVKA
jgi:hypothetical protein